VCGGSRVQDPCLASMDDGNVLEDFTVHSLRDVVLLGRVRCSPPGKVAILGVVCYERERAVFTSVFGADSCGLGRGGGEWLLGERHVMSRRCPEMVSRGCVRRSRPEIPSRCGVQRWWIFSPAGVAVPMEKDVLVAIVGDPEIGVATKARENPESSLTGAFPRVVHVSAQEDDSENNAGACAGQGKREFTRDVVQRCSPETASKTCVQ
jgi:hypothetical protein